MVTDAVAIMAERNYGAMIVVDGDDKVAGILTERDVVKRIVGAGKSTKGMKVADIMTRDPSVAREEDEADRLCIRKQRLFVFSEARPVT